MTNPSRMLPENESVSLRRRNVAVRYERLLLTWDACILLNSNGR